MPSIAEIVDFLLSLMRDEDTRGQFARDPDAALADRGLADVTAQDVRDARLIMADTGAVQPRAGSRPERGSGSDNDPVREIHHTTTHFEVGDVTTTVLTVHDNDTLIVDSFNNDVVAIQDNDSTDVDVISIQDNDTAAPAEDEPDAAAREPGDGTDTDDPTPEPAGESTEDPADADQAPGASEGFAPELDAGFGARPELGAETEFTPDEPPADELVG